MEKKRFLLPICCLVIVGVIISIFEFLKSEYDLRPTLNVLMLHMVTEKMPEDDNLSTLYITDKMLREYCEYFLNNYQVVSLNEAYDIIKNNKKVENPNLLVYTFDDGYDNNYTLAYPILKDLGIKANINIIAKYTDENRDGYLTWDQIKDMSKSGLIEFGSHTYDSHYYTDDENGILGPVLSITLPGENKEIRHERIFNDLTLADNMISSACGNKINIMTYPYGVPPFDLIDEIGNHFGYTIQVLVRPGINRDEVDFNKLKRITVDGSKKPYELERIMKNYKGLDFLAKLKSGDILQKGE